MSSNDLALSTEKRPSRKERNDDDMPSALLEFHSPSAAIAAMPPTPSARYITWIISSMALVTILVMALFPIDRVVSAQGGLVPTVPTLVAQPLETSIVRSINVHEGDVVHKGQLLAHLDPTLSNADIGNLSQQSQSLDAEVKRLTAQVTGKEYVVDPANPASTQQAAIFLRRQSDYTSKMQNYNQQIAGLQSDLVGYQASAAMYGGRVKVASDVHNMRVRLQQDQVGSRLNSLASQDELMEIERSQITAQQNAMSARNKLNAMIAERDSYVQSSQAEAYQSLTEAQRKYYEMNSDYQKAKLRKSLVVLYAPQDAVVLNIAKVSVGSIVQAAQEIITMTPLNAPLEIQGRLPAAQAGYVKVGDPANVKFETFAYVQYGGADATVTNISADSFSMDQEQATMASAPANAMGTPGGQAQPFYRIRLRIDRYTLHGVPSFFRPTPGMQVTAEVKVGKRTILQFLLGNIIPVATEGMRDP